jgi:hypothetical protein
MFIKNVAKIAMLSIASFAFAGVALAYSPTLSVVREGSSDSARFTVTGASPYSSVNLYRRQGTALWTTINNFGQTDVSGYFTQVSSLGSDGSATAIEQYVTVNGQQSNIVQTNQFGGGACSVYGYGCGSGTIQKNISLALGQSQSTVFEPSVYGTPIYISSNSNQSVVSASILNNYSVYFTGLTTGTSTIMVCQNNYNFCVVYNVSVGGSSSYGTLTFSQNGAAMSVGQNTSVQIFSNMASSGSYYLSSNSNSSVVDASVSSNTLYLTARAVGSSNVSVCQYNTNACGTVFVTVSGGGTVTFNPSSVQMVQGQTQTVTVYSSQNSYAGFYITGNTTNNAIIATVNTSNNSISLYAASSGSGQITVCQSGTLYCGSLSVTAGGSVFPIVLSQNSLTLQAGQSSSVDIYGNIIGNYYVSSNSNPGIVSTTIVNGKINVYAVSAGTTTLSICGQNTSGCANLTVTVNNVLGIMTGQVYFSSVTIPTPQVGRYYSQQLSVTGGYAPYNYTLESGTLPNGLYLSNSGQVYGNPVYAQTSDFVVRVTDAYGKSALGYFRVTVSSIYPGIYPPVVPSVLGASIYPNGKLISENGTVYIVYKDTKSSFASQAVFRGLGYKFSNVQEVGVSGLVNSGYVVNSTRTFHPWGSWIKNGTTIYFVHENGLIPVPDLSVFSDNNGELKNVVPANRYDFDLQILSVMEYNDARLK